MPYYNGNKLEIVEKAMDEVKEEIETINDNIKLAKLIENIKKKYTIDELLNTLPYEKSDMEIFENISNFNWEEYINKQIEILNPSNKKLTYNLTKNELISTTLRISGAT